MNMFLSVTSGVFTAVTSTTTGSILSISGIFLTIYSVVRIRSIGKAGYFIFDPPRASGTDHFSAEASGGMRYFNRPKTDSLLVITNGGRHPILKSDLSGEIRFLGNTKGLGGRFIEVNLVTSKSDDSEAASTMINEDLISLSFKLLRPGDFLIYHIRHSYLNCCLALDLATNYDRHTRRSETINFLIAVDFILSYLIFFIIFYVVFIASFIFLNGQIACIVGVLAGICVGYISFVAFKELMKRIIIPACCRSVLRLYCGVPYEYLSKK